MNDKRIFSMLGLAMKAGKVTSGEFMVETSVKASQSKLVIVAEDASNNTKKNFSDMCTYYHVPLVFFGSKTALGAAIGKEFRASLSVNDEGFAAALKTRIDSEKSDGGSEKDE